MFFLLIICSQAWHLCDPEAERVFKALKKAGVKIAIVSNFDTRLRPLLRALNCDHWFDAVAVSAEVSYSSLFIGSVGLLLYVFPAAPIVFHGY